MYIHACLQSFCMCPLLLAGTLLRPQYASGPPPVQHQSPNPDRMLSPPRGTHGRSGLSSPPQPGPPRDPRSQGQTHTRGRGYNQAQRQQGGLTSAQDWGDPPATHASSQHTSFQDQHHPRDAYGNVDYSQRQQQQQQQQQLQEPYQHAGEDYMQAPSNGDASVRYGRGGGHVSGAKAILLPGPLGPQPNRGRGRGRSDGSRGRGRNLRGRG